MELLGEQAARRGARRTRTGLAWCLLTAKAYTTALRGASIPSSQHTDGRGGFGSRSGALLGAGGRLATSDERLSGEAAPRAASTRAAAQPRAARRPAPPPLPPPTQCSSFTAHRSRSASEPCFTYSTPQDARPLELKLQSKISSNQPMSR